MHPTPRDLGSGVLLALGLIWASPASGQDPGVPAPPQPALTQDVRETGPPVERPAEDPEPAPAPNLFYVPGEYVPDGDGVRWRTGYWAQQQPGWTWVPARWVRTSDGWTFRDGSWVRSGALQEQSRQDLPTEQARATEQALATEQAFPAQQAPPSEQAGDPNAPVAGPVLPRESITYNIFNPVVDPFALGAPIAPRFVPAAVTTGYFWDPYPAWGYPYMGWGTYGAYLRSGGLGFGGFGMGWGGWGWGMSPVGFGLRVW